MRTVLDIASSLSQMAELMEIKGENQFKVRAFQVAAEILLAYRYDSETLLQTIKSTGIPKIGTNLAAKITELSVSDSCDEFDQLLKEVPLSVLDLRAVPGLGAKKVKTLWQELGLASLDQLEEACLANKLLELKGFGEKQQCKILEGIKNIKRFRGWMRQPRAFYLASFFESFIRQKFQKATIEIAGQVRRKLEAVSQIEFIIAGVDPEELKILLQASAETETVELNSDQIVILNTKKSEKVIFSLMPEDKVSSQLLLVGSDLSFIDWANKNLDLSSPVKTEREIFNNAKIEFITPELREQEMQSSWGKQAEQDLIKTDQIRGIIHCHSTYSDGIDPLKDMAIAAKDLGFGYLGIADHSFSARYANGLSIDRVLQQHSEIEILNQELAPFRILKGIESDITLSGELDYPDNVLEQFDFIVASVHSGFQMSRQEMTDRVVRALKNPFTSILGHPTGRLLLEREGYEIDLQEIIKVAIDQQVLLEINASPYRLDLDWRWVALAKEQGAKFSIDPDSHRIAGFSDLQYGTNVARKAGLIPNDVANTAEVELFLKQLRLNTKMVNF